MSYLLSLASIFKITGSLSTVSSKLEWAIFKEHRAEPRSAFYKRMPTGQNPVQPMTQATKYYKSLSLLFFSPFLPRERLVASP